MTVRIEFRDPGGIVRFDGNDILWDGVNTGDEAAQPGDIVDTVQVSEIDGTQAPWQFEVPVTEVVEPNTSYTSRLALDWGLGDGRYKIELWLQQGANGVSGWREFEIAYGRLRDVNY